MTRVDICQDCYCAAANGIGDQYAQFPDGFAQAWAAAWERNGAGDLVPWIDPDTGDGDYGFSWSPCEWCGTTLGGDRYRATWIPADPDSTVGELAERLRGILSPDSWASVRMTTTQVKLGHSALAELVTLLETHVTGDGGNG